MAQARANQLATILPEQFKGLPSVIITDRSGRALERSAMVGTLGVEDGLTLFIGDRDYFKRAVQSRQVAVSDVILAGPSPTPSSPSSTSTIR